MSFSTSKNESFWFGASVGMFSYCHKNQVLQENDRSQRLARLVRRLRRDASTYTFGAQLGVTHSTIRRWESGRGGINEEAIEKLSTGTGISADTIRAYLRGGISLRACLGLEEPLESQSQIVIEQLPKLSTQELLTVLETTIAHLLSRLPNIRPEVAQILQSAISLLSIPRSSSRSNISETPESIAEQFLPQTLQDAILDEIEARYGSVNSMTITRFAEDVGIQPSEAIARLLQGESPKRQDLDQLQGHLCKFLSQPWTIEELLNLAQ
ncbi:helix-turn-helix domain-containing protein [Leptolyngbya sp. GGD]|uniref:helix-turn-helix domain-containing protein n=1 Tax=Leptolyngbya sp. GGD TaxID=2997907 RepID=UPI00227C3F86|nr:helix-turn-helix transcriptional regulator [Leptolyngbya sp. GGD]MCY6493393.1 helix-turn-helix transcriptional regulator [Leptolyngbya sp. GGD]